ncbi:hypothetical protein BDP27DRAFT_64902 [Rhodocollybia butyracea]|uniref:DUF6534 domain-containing protein n=1 Tax=Rhodocollybia butyracea TaxID=206335 RepID=A0A9P5PNI2_9AGAR|nr:hypothetical protein BDP27DRAFT_64902 [Rhodocollybia butyracea]
MRVFVLFIIVLDFSHQGLICHTLYVYVITGYDKPDELKTVVWSLLVEVLVNGLIAFSVQSFLSWRIWRLSNSNIWLTAFVMTLVFSELGCITAYALIALTRIRTFVELAVHLKGLSIAVNVLAAAGDVLIASSLAYLLQTSKTGFRNSDTMINKLTLFAVNTGALTSICAMASLVSILVFPATFVYISFFFCMGRLYTNSLLATLNARAGIRALGGIHTSDEDQSFLDLEGDTSLLKRLGMMSSSVVSLGRKRVPEAIAMVATEAEPYLPPTPPNSPC